MLDLGQKAVTEKRQVLGCDRPVGGLRHFYAALAETDVESRTKYN